MRFCPSIRLDHAPWRGHISRAQAYQSCKWIHFGSLLIRAHWFLQYLFDHCVNGSNSSFTFLRSLRNFRCWVRTASITYLVLPLFSIIIHEKRKRNCHELVQDFLSYLFIRDRSKAYLSVDLVCFSFWLALDQICSAILGCQLVNLVCLLSHGIRALADSTDESDLLAQGF